MGLILAKAATRELSNWNWNFDLSCRVATRTIPIAIRTADTRASATRGLGNGQLSERIYAREAEFVAAMRAEHPTVDCEITVIRIGDDFSLVTNGAELFCQPALDIQQASPFKKTWIVTLANEYRGYVPTREAHHAGGYEARLARSSYLAVDAAEKIAQTSLEGLAALR